MNDHSTYRSSEADEGRHGLHWMGEDEAVAQQEACQRRAEEGEREELADAHAAAFTTTTALATR